MRSRGVNKMGKKQVKPESKEELAERITKIVQAMGTPAVFTIGARPDGRRDILRIENAGLDSAPETEETESGKLPRPESLSRRLNYIG
jgi:hypothetical protein